MLHIAAISQIRLDTEGRADCGPSTALTAGRTGARGFQVHLEHANYFLRVHRGLLVELARRPRPVDAVITTERDVLQAVLTGALDAEAAQALGRLGSTGDHTAVANLLTSVGGSASLSGP